MRHLMRTAAWSCLVLAPGLPAWAAAPNDPPAAASAEPGPDADVVDEIIVTARRDVRSNAVVDPVRIERLSGAQNIVDAIRSVPGVSIRGSDPFNTDPWSYGVSIRGFDVNLRSSKIGQTIDDMPAGTASYYLAGTPAQKFLINENVSGITVNQGAAGVSSVSSSALGGTIAYSTREPSAESETRVSITLGDNNLQRYAVIHDFGTLFGNTRLYIGASSLETCRWVYGCADQSGSEQAHAEIKFVTDLTDRLSLTGFASYDDSIDDPYVEASRAFLDSTDAGDFSVPSFVPSARHTTSDPNQNWANRMSSERRNAFGYLKLQWRPTETVELQLNPYWHNQEGLGYRAPPYQQIALDQRDPANIRRTVTGGTAVGSRRVNGFYGVTLNGRQRAVIPGVTYTDTDGTVVASSQCYAAGTAYSSSGENSFAGMNNPACAPLQSWRNSLYAHDRYGVVARASAELGRHQLNAGLWHERLDRDFGRAWRQIVDIRAGSPAAYDEFQLLDFQQHFKTDLTKLWLSDTITFDRFTVDVGVQQYFIDLEGITEAWDASGAPGPGLPTEANADSDPLFSIGFTYEITPDWQGFASYSENYGAVGDWALEKTGTDLTRLTSSVANNIDVGLRYSSPRLALTAAYRTRYDNPITFRTADFVSVNGGTYNYTVGTSGSFVNAGEGVESTGLELGAVWRATSDLTVTGALTFNESTYLSDFIGGTASGGGDKTVKAGNDVPNAPPLVADFGVEYRRGPFTGVIGLNYQDETAGDALNTPGQYLPARTLVNLTAAYQVPQLDDVSLQVNVSNLLDEDYIGGVLDDFTQLYTRGAPRTVSATLRARF